MTTTNPLLEEIWAIKNRLDTEAGGDIHVFCQQLRDWSVKNLPEGMVIRDPAELHTQREKIALREEPPEYGTKAE